MNRLFVFLAVIALVIALPVTHEAFAGNNNSKVEICHVNSSNSPGIWEYDYRYLYISYGNIYSDYDYTATTTYHLGKVVSVDASAVDAHVAHGDSTLFYDLSDYTVDYIENLTDYDYSYSYEYGDPSGYPYYSYYSYNRENTNGVIKNANCYWTTFERVDH